ncbi:MAG: hypothetical protein V4676_09940 [Bacteroidota bacterium]
MKKLLTALITIFVLASCQKEISLEPNNNGGTGGTGGNTNGDLLVKALEITIATNDTNVLTFEYDAQKRLTNYNSTGVVNGLPTLLNTRITRASDGKILNIVAKSSFSGGVDSTIYKVFYVAGTNKLSYVLSTQVTFIGDLNDSTTYTYNAAGQVVSKETFSDLFGSWDVVEKRQFTYDANANVVKTESLTPNGSGGYDLNSTSTYTYDGRKTAIQMGDESFIAFGAENFSGSNVTKIVSNAVASGTTYTGIFSGQQFNSFNRPTIGTLTVTPQPPGYSVKLLYYYQ